MILTDILIITCIGFNMFLGYKKGFIWSFFGLTSYLIAALCSKLFYLDVAYFIRNNTGLVDKLEGFIQKNFFSLFQEGVGSTAEVGEGTFKGTGLLGDFFLQDLQVQTYANQTIDLVKGEIVKGISALLLNIISIVLIFVIVKVAILFIGTMLDQIFKLPILNSINKTGGLLIGGLKGMSLVLLVLMVMVVFASLSPEGAVALAIENSFLLQVFFNDLVPPLINWLL